MIGYKVLRNAILFTAVLSAGSLSIRPVSAQPTPPDTTVCDSETCDTLASEICTPAGYVFTLKGYTAAPSTTTGIATYTYEICNPTAGLCTIDGVSTLTSCQSHEECRLNTCPTNGNGANTCNRDGVTQCTTASDCNDPTLNYCSGKTVRDMSTDCVPDTIKGLGLSHFDVSFPALGGVGSCLGTNTIITGSCSASSPATVGSFVLGDGACFAGTSPVAKCDSTFLPPGGCITMTLNIPGELNKPGLGLAVVVDKEGQNCEASCLQGPSCEPCDEIPSGGACLTRTIGFWGTHPWITNDYDPVTVCGKTLGCDSAGSDGKSNPTCSAGSCTSIMEGLGSIGGESSKDAAYISMLKQLTAAKLNLNATAALFQGATCADWLRQNRTIQEWINYCETLCNGNQAMISNSGCIEALTAFNTDQDVGFTVTPSPFDRPPVDDFGNISGADGSQFTAAQGNSTFPGKWVIGKKIGSNDCR